MIIPTTKEDLETLIKDGVEESQQLEYKDAQALETPKGLKEIGKDVSAMANGSGGVVIYGIKEYDSSDKRHLPELITPLKHRDFPKERVEQIINGNISPRIEGLIVHPIPLHEESDIAFAVEIPQSHTAHQSTHHFIYYRRYNFQVLPMLDHEVRDVMNRLTYPKIGIEFEIEMHYNPNTLPDAVDVYRRRYETSFILKISLVNEGKQFAKYVNYFLELPHQIVDEKVTKSLNRISNTTLQFTGENTVRDIVDETLSPTTGATLKYGPSRFVPLLPGLKSKAQVILLAEDISIDDSQISWKVYADNAPPKVGRVKLHEIKLTRKYNY